MGPLIKILVADAFLHIKKLKCNVNCLEGSKSVAYSKFYKLTYKLRVNVKNDLYNLLKN